MFRYCCLLDIKPSSIDRTIDETRIQLARRGVLITPEALRKELYRKGCVASPIVLSDRPSPSMSLFACPLPFLRFPLFFHAAFCDSRLSYQLRNSPRFKAVTIVLEEVNQLIDVAVYRKLLTYQDFLDLLRYRVLRNKGTLAQFEEAYGGYPVMQSASVFHRSCGSLYSHPMLPGRIAADHRVRRLFSLSDDVIAGQARPIPVQGREILPHIAAILVEQQARPPLSPSVPYSPPSSPFSRRICFLPCCPLV